MTSEQQHFSGLILAGGKSLRFGADKATALIRGKPMINTVADVVADVTSELIVSVASVEQRYDVKGSFVEDVFQNCGPLGGLHAGLSVASNEWILCASCDLPFVEVDDLVRLMEQARLPATAVVAIDSRDLKHPLCACYHASLLPVAEAHILSGRFAIHDLIDRAVLRTVRLPDRSLTNINRLSDIEESNLL